MIRVWEASTGDVVSTLDAPNVGPYSWIALHPSGDSVAYIAEKSVVVLDVTAGETIARFEGHDAAVVAVAFSPDGRTLASGGLDETIRLWAVPDGTALRTPSPSDGDVCSVQFGRDGRLLATSYCGMSRCQVTIWDLETLLDD